jgi:serine/threonine protein kinase
MLGEPDRSVIMPDVPRGESRSDASAADSASAASTPAEAFTTTCASTALPPGDAASPAAGPAPGSAPDPLGTSAGAPVGSAASPPPLGTLADYDLLAVIGQGGMGTVYRAWDRRLGRDVAVKVLHERYAIDSLAARRFVAEARITGQLQHPGIPPVHEMGTLPDGRPFLVMKLIQGRTLAEILKDRESRGPGPSPVTNRGSLIPVFEQVCQAVAYAHSHGVIHRDLKPANIMIGAFGEVQVMDWGLAKLRGEARRRTTTADAADHDPTPIETDSLTQSGAILGTPAFMSPEQARGLLEQIDERSDVFGLGAILCVLLTGQPPFVGTSAESTRQLAASGQLGAALAGLAACEAEPALVALCQRCLSVQPADRPRNAGEVADALEAIRTAADDRAREAELQRARAEAAAVEQAKRRRLLAGATLVVMLVLSAAVGVSLWQAAVARTEAANARTAEANARDQAEQARRAEAAARDAQAGEHEGRQTAEQAFAFIKTVLSYATSAGQGGKNPKAAPTVREALTWADQTLSQRTNLPPRVEAEVRKTLGELFFRMQTFDQALIQYDRVRQLRLATVGPDHELTWQALNDLGVIYKRLLNYEKAEELLLTALASKRARLGNDHRSTQRTVANLGDLYREWKRFDEAEPLLREAYTTRRRLFGPDDPDSLTSTNNLGAFYYRRGQPHLAEPYFREAAEGYERTKGITFHAAQCWSNTADAIHAQHRYADAVPIYHKALAILQQITPEEGRALRDQIHSQLVQLYTAAGQPDEAAQWKPQQLPLAPPPRERPR